MKSSHCHISWGSRESLRFLGQAQNYDNINIVFVGSVEIPCIAYWYNAGGIFCC